MSGMSGMSGMSAMSAGRVVAKIVNVWDREDGTAPKSSFRCQLEILYTSVQSEPNPNSATDVDPNSGIDVVAIQNSKYGTSTWLYQPEANDNRKEMFSDIASPADLDLRKRANLLKRSSSLDVGEGPGGGQVDRLSPLTGKVKERRDPRDKSKKGELETDAFKRKVPPPTVVNWLKDSNMLPQEIANVRIMNFEYPTDIEFGAEEQYDMVAKELMDQLHEKRRICPARSLLFIACGIGGFLLQAALTPRKTAKIKSTLCTANSLFSYITGIVLLVVEPFAFSTTENPESKTEDIERYGQVYERQTIDEMLQQICPTLPFRLGHKMKERGIPMKCFHRIGSTIPRVPGGLTASSLAESDSLMSRYSGPYDLNYLTVLSFIKECIQRQSLFVAVATGDRERLRILLKEGINPSIRNRFGKTALHLAALKTRADLMDDLLNNAADIGAVDNKGRTALHLATMRSDEAAVQILLRRGADTDVPDNEKNSPAMLAERLAERTDTTRSSRDVLQLFQQRPLLQGPSTSPTQRQYKIEISPPSSSEQRYACDTFRGVVAMFYGVKHGAEERELRSVETRAIRNLLYGSDLHTTSFNIGEGETHNFTWYHIPSNNVSISENKRTI